MQSGDVPDPLVAILLNEVRDQFGWLREDGYEETKAIIVRSHFHLFYEADQGTVIVSVEPWRSSVEIWVSPPRSEARPRLMVQSILKLRGLPYHSGHLDSSSSSAAIQDLHAVLEDLKLLRHRELAGDWSDLDAAVHMTRRDAGLL